MRRPPKAPTSGAIAADPEHVVRVVEAVLDQQLAPWQRYVLVAMLCGQSVRERALEDFQRSELIGGAGLD